MRTITAIDLPTAAPSTCETSTENTTRLRRKAMTPCKIPTPTFNKQTNANLRNSQGDSTVLKKNYAHNSRYASSQELRDSFETNLPPMPPLPRRATSSTTEIHEQNTALAAFEREHHPIKQSKEQESYFAADSPFYSASHGRLSRVVRPNSGVFGRPSTVVPLQGSQQREGDDPVSTMPMKFSVSSGLSNGNGSVYSRQATASRIPQSSSRPAGLQATQYCQKPFRTNQQSVNGDRGVALPRPSLGRAGSSRSSLIDKPLPALPSSSTAQSVFPPRKTSLQPSSLSHSLFSSVRLDNNVNIEETPPLSHDGDNTSGQVSATSISEPSHANPAAPVNSTAKNEDEEGDISLVHEDQDLRYWAGRFTAIDDHICNDATFSRDAQWAHNVTLRHNHVLQLLHEKCRTRAAQDSLTSFTRAWSGGWSGGVRGVYRGGVVLPPRNFLLEEQKKKNGLMGKVFGRKKSKD